MENERYLVKVQNIPNDAAAANAIAKPEPNIFASRINLPKCSQLLK